MAKSLKLAHSITSKLVSSSSFKLLTLPRQSSQAVKHCYFNLSGLSTSRAHSTLSVLKPSMHNKMCQCVACTTKHTVKYSTEVEKELSQFLEKEVRYENTRSSDKLPKIPGFEVTTEGGNVTLTKTSNAEKIVVKLSVNGTVDSVESDESVDKEGEPPQMVSRPPFQVEIIKGDSVLALHCAFPSSYPEYDEEGHYRKPRPEDQQFDDQFEIQEVSIHGGEWKESTYSVTTDSMDPQLFDLLMDMLDERGINDEFVAHLIDFCTVYENQQYVNFLQSLKKFAEK